MAKTNLPMMIGSRYSRAKRRNGFISFISAISMSGIAIGVWVLISVISIMNGFGNELRGRILDVAPHVSITGQGNRLDDWQALRATVDANPEVAGYAPYIYSQGLLTFNGAVTGSLVKGVLPEEESKVSDIANVVGIFGGIGPDEFDSALAYIHMSDAAKLYKTKGKVSGLRLKLKDPFEARLVSAQLADKLQYRFYVDNWTTQHKSFFRALEVERRMVFIVLFMIVLIAAFNIVSTLVMVVIDKRADIAILRTLGLSPAKVMGIFFVQGVTSGVIGTIIGTIAGVLTALNLANIIGFIERQVGFELLPASVYIVTDFPAELRWDDVWVIVVTSLAFSMLATLYPAWSASKTQPAEALRYE